MTKKPKTSKEAADKVVKNIRRKTRQTYSAEEKIRIERWSQDFGPVVKVDQLVKEMIQNDETKEPLA